ncbi:ABC transporter permease [Persicirhabdus sediminis]
MIDRKQKLGAGILLILLVLVLANRFTSNDIASQNLDSIFDPPSLTYPLGTDQFGRCNLARISSAILTSLSMASICVITASTIGTLTGFFSAWYGGHVDRFFSTVVNIIMALPGLIIVLLFSSIIPGSFFMIYLSISLVLWLEYFRVVRARVMSLKSEPAVQMSQLYGFNLVYILRRHLWPSIKTDLATLACFGAGNAILILASIGFVYVGLRPPDAELGLMMVELFPYYSDAPWVLAQPLLAIFALVLAFNLLAKGGSNDAID